jgi:hypothetical protein
MDCLGQERTLVRIPATVAEQLRLLDEHPARGGGGLVRALSRLGRDVALAVPSSLAVTIVLDRTDGEVSVSALADPAPVLASLAVPLSAGLLILRAGAAGAYLLLADDLRGGLGPAETDAHLGWPAFSGESLAAALAELGSRNRAIGVLIGQGLTPEDARQELDRRARDAG